MDPDMLFALMNDTTRRRMLRLLLAESALCVCELCAALEADQPKVSRHLARMREAGLVEDRRAAQWIVYRVPEAMRGALGALLTAAESIAGAEAVDADRARLASMTARPPRAARAA